jgi:precorrin-6Y C5,15-methyltransferase (decarboxylating)
LLQAQNKIYVIGIGYRPLEKKARNILLNAKVILTSDRLFAVFKRYDEYGTVKDRIKVINKVPETLAFIKDRISHPESQPLALLASGDPLFFGIGRKLSEEFGKDVLEILPDLSSIQQAFARINEPWDDAFLMSLHGGPDPAKRRKLPYEMHDIPFLLEQHGKIAILTDKVNNPSVIATVIARSETTKQSQIQGIASPLARNDSIRMIVCERLGYLDEKIIKGTPKEMEGMSFSEPNVVIVMKQGSGSGGQGPEGIRFGLKENEIEHARGLITKDEVRAVTLHTLRLPETGVFWDVGAGSGSISIEAARLFPGLTVIAVEKDDEQVKRIKANKIKFSVKNIELVQGTAPDALHGLQAPDRVFVGGSGGSLDEIIGSIQERMRDGIIVINAVTIETLNQAIAGLEKRGFTVKVSEISVSRSKLIAGKRHMSAQNPIFIVTGEKG